MNRKRSFETTEEASSIAKIMRKDGRTYEEIADVLGVSIGQARYYTLLHVAKCNRNMRLIEAINKSGMTQVKLAEISKLSLPTIRKAMDGSDPRLSTARSLAKALCMNIDDIF